MTLTESHDYKCLSKQGYRINLLHNPIFFQDEAQFLLYERVAGETTDSSWFEKLFVA